MSPRVVHVWRTCPGCGLDLLPLQPKKVGDLFADPKGTTTWKGQRVRLNATQRIILDTIVTGDGRVSRRVNDEGYAVSSLTIAERADISIDSVNVMMHAIRKRFRKIDPDFNHIQTDSGAYKWSETRVPKVLGRMLRPVLTLYDNGECDWKLHHRIFLGPREAQALLILMKAEGRPVPVAELGGVFPGSINKERLGYSLMNRLRTKFAKADPSVKFIGNNGSGPPKGGFWIIRTGGAD